MIEENEMKVCFEIVDIKFDGVAAKVIASKKPELIGTEIEVDDRSGCILNRPPDDLVGAKGLAAEWIDNAGVKYWQIEELQVIVSSEICD